MQPDGGLAEDVEHTHQAGADLRRQADALGFAARESARCPVECEVIEADAEQQPESAPDLVEDLPAGVGPFPPGLEFVHELGEFVEMQVTKVLYGASLHLEQQPRVTQPGAVAVLAGGVHHDAVEPALHARVGHVSLTVPAVVALDVVADATKLCLVPQPAFLFLLGIRRHHQLERLVQSEEDRVADLLWQVLPGLVEVEFQPLRQGVDDVTPPVVGPVGEGLADEAAAADAASGIGHQQVGVGLLVHADTAARAAGALGVVEHEELG